MGAGSTVCTPGCIRMDCLDTITFDDYHILVTCQDARMLRKAALQTLQPATSEPLQPNIDEQGRARAKGSRKTSKARVSQPAGSGLML